MFTYNFIVISPKSLILVCISLHPLGFYGARGSKIYIWRICLRYRVWLCIDIHQCEKVCSSHDSEDAHSIFGYSTPSYYSASLWWLNKRGTYVLYKSSTFKSFTVNWYNNLCMFDKKDSLWDYWSCHNQHCLDQIHQGRSKKWRQETVLN